MRTCRLCHLPKDESAFHGDCGRCRACLALRAWATSARLATGECSTGRRAIIGSTEPQGCHGRCITGRSQLAWS